jgi:hypothetical protein
MVDASAVLRERIHSKGVFVCRKAFKDQGHSFEPGDNYPWRQLSISERRVLQMWDGRWITTKETWDEEKAIMVRQDADRAYINERLKLGMKLPTVETEETKPEEELAPVAEVFEPEADAPAEDEGDKYRYDDI